MAYTDTYFNPADADSGIPLEGTLYTIYTSTDGGVTWAAIKNLPLTLANGGPYPTTYMGGEALSGGQGNYDSDIYTPDGHNLYVIGQEYRPRRAQCAQELGAVERHRRCRRQLDRHLGGQQQ